MVSSGAARYNSFRRLGRADYRYVRIRICFRLVGKGGGR